MPVETWEDLDAAINHMIDDATYRQWRPLIDKLQALVGARGVNIDTAKGLLSVIEAMHGGKIQPGSVVEELAKKGSAFAQPNWQVDTVIQLVVNTLPQLRTADPVIPVPIVLVVMTADEAAALASCAAFAAQMDPLRKDFEALEADLKNVLDGWIAQYGARPEDWRPFGEALTIEQRATQALQEYGDSLRIAKRLVPKFVDVRTLRENRVEVLRLRRDGCIVVLDTISLRHPTLIGAFQRTLLDAYPGTAVLTVVPHQKVRDLTRGLIYSLQLSMGESELSKRRIDPGEYGVCVEVTGFEDFPPWLQTRVKQICSKAIAEGGIRADMNA
jgi:hypothetical protein